VDDPLKRIKELLALRQPYYERADIMVDTEGKTPLQVAEEIMERIRLVEDESRPG
jgi:shikimate dehydrogenase